MRLLTGSAPETSRTIPIAIRRSGDGQESEGTFVISLSDIAARPDVYSRVRKAETAYKKNVIQWRNMLERVRSNKSDPILRWQLADSILKFQVNLRTRWQFEAGNYRQAVARELAISKSVLGYLYRLRGVFSLDDVRSSGANWSKIQELLDVRNPEMMKAGMALLRKGQLKYDSDVRAFKRKANSQGNLRFGKHQRA